MFAVFIPALSAVGGAAITLAGVLVKLIVLDKPAQKTNAAIQQQQADLALMAELRLQAGELRAQAEFWRSQVAPLKGEVEELRGELAAVKAELAQLRGGAGTPNA